MALLVDKHRPRSLDALSYHPELSDRLKALVKPSKLPQKLTSVASLTSFLVGRERRLPSFTHLWSFRCGQEDEDLGDIESTLWPRCGKDQD